MQQENKNAEHAKFNEQVGPQRHIVGNVRTAMLIANVDAVAVEINAIYMDLLRTLRHVDVETVTKSLIRLTIEEGQQRFKEETGLKHPAFDLTLSEYILEEIVRQRLKGKSGVQPFRDDAHIAILNVWKEYHGTQQEFADNMWSGSLSPVAKALAWYKKKHGQKFEKPKPRTR